MTNNAAPQDRLFDLKQRADGAWAVWTRKSPLDLNMIDRAAISAQRPAGDFSDDEWAEFIKLPHVCDPTIPVIAAIYQTRPTTDAVLELLGVKRRVPVEAPRRPRQNIRRPAPAAQPQEAAA